MIKNVPSEVGRSSFLRLSAAVILFFAVYAALLSVVALLFLVVYYTGLQIIIAKPAFVIVSTGVGLLGFGSLVLFHIIKFFFTPWKHDKVVYAVIVGAASALIAVCAVAGIWIVMVKPLIVATILGVGVIVTAGLVLFFLLRSLFTVSPDGNVRKVEITEDDQPQLFAFVRQLTRELRVAFPRKIFVSAAVGNRVFYTTGISGVWVPGRGNLEIGFGLVNAVNTSEFKALLAAEFGYISGKKRNSKNNRTLVRFGYRANYLIYKMLYETNRDVKFMQSWAKKRDMFAFFASPASTIGHLMLMILKKVYNIINKAYLPLSHEISFQADAIAAGVAGVDHLTTGLRRAEIAEGAYAVALNAASAFMKEKKATRNIFSNQLTVLRSLFSFSKSRINSKNQWTGYLTVEERVQHLEYTIARGKEPFSNKIELDITDAIKLDTIDTIKPNETSAWTLFNNSKALQETLTANLYKEINQHFQYYEDDEFDKWYQTNPYKLPSVYKGFYNQRYINLINWDLSLLAAQPVQVQFTDLFNEENARLSSFISRNEKDIATLKSIKEGHIRTNSFDFEGTKFTSSSCDEIIARIEDDTLVMKEKILQIDKQAFAFFYQQNNSVMDLYQQYQTIQQHQITFFETVEQVINLINAFYADTLTTKEIQLILSKIATHEIVIKKVLRSLIEEDIIEGDITSGSALYKQISNYINSQYVYYSDKGKHDEELYLLREVLTDKRKLLEEMQHKYYRKMITEQLSKVKGCLNI